MKLTNKIALITGGSEGIGLAAAEEFLREGATVFITGRRQQTLDAAIHTLGPNATAIQADAGSLADLDRVLAEIKQRHGRLDVVFANAGIYPQIPIDQWTEEDFDKSFNINVKGVFFLMQKARALMSADGSIILNASFLAHKPFPGMTVYSATKAAVVSLARGFTAEFRGSGPRVNVISPGPIDTPGNADSLGSNEQVRAFVTQMVPLGRIGEAADIAKAAVFLASADAKYIAATELFVDGGLRAT